MNTDPKIYGNGFDPKVLKDVKDLGEKIEKATSSEEVLKLRTQRLYRGMELNATTYGRPYRGLYPY